MKNSCDIAKFHLIKPEKLVYVLFNTFPPKTWRKYCGLTITFEQLQIYVCQYFLGTFSRIVSVCEF